MIIMTNNSIRMIAGLAFFAFVAEAGAAELMGDGAWDFNNQTSRAGVASLMMQKENSQSATGIAAAGNACGGGGTATATGNYTCIILNNSSALIDALQDTTGDQSAGADSDVSVNGAESDLGSVLEGLTN
jgi:hypothetical protein